MRLEIVKTVTEKTEVEIETFLLEGEYIFNPLFSSPLWARRLEDLINFKSEFLIVREDDKIIALLLVFKGYRGYVKIGKLPIIVKEIALLYSKKFFSYITWYNFIIFKKELNREKKEKAKSLIYKYINSLNMKILKAPIFDEDEKFFKERRINTWGTYIIDLRGKTYEEVYREFRKQARSSIRKTRERGVIVKKLSLEEISNFVSFLKKAQKVTGKNYKINRIMVLQEFKRFKKKNYIFEIFIGILDGEIIGSLGIWGFNDFITEFGVNYLNLARENKLYVQDVIKDEIIKYCLQKKINFYDLAGFNPDINAIPKERNIRRFKKKWGGKEFIYKILE